jgi:hypothetical protein
MDCRVVSKGTYPSSSFLSSSASSSTGIDASIDVDVSVDVDVDVDVFVDAEPAEEAMYAMGSGVAHSILSHPAIVARRRGRAWDALPAGSKQGGNSQYNVSWIRT